MISSTSPDTLTILIPPSITSKLAELASKEGTTTAVKAASLLSEALDKLFDKKPSKKGAA